MSDDRHWAEAWAVDLCSLLDAIEKHATDERMVRLLLAERFKIAVKHGLQVQALPGEAVGTA